MSKNVTYKDISEKTGISIATISRIVKGNVIVSPEKNKLVREAMVELGYPLPKMIQEMNDPLIMIYLPSISNPFYSKIIEGIKTVANNNGFKTIICEGEINSYTIDEVISMVKRLKIDGLISLNFIAPEHLEQLEKVIPTVQCSERNPDINYPFVSIDDISAAKKAVDLLVAHGNKRIAFINGPKGFKYSADRYTGYKSALEGSGIPIDPLLHIQLPEIDFDIAISVVTQLLHSSNAPDAFFTSSDVFAAAVLRAAKMANIKVPEQLEVIGFDNVDISKMCIPSITTVSQPRYQLGLNSCQVLIKILDRGFANVQSLYLSTEIIIRESTR